MQETCFFCGDTGEHIRCDYCGTTTCWDNWLLVFDMTRPWDARWCAMCDACGSEHTTGDE